MNYFSSISFPYTPTLFHSDSIGICPYHVGKLVYYFVQTIHSCLLYNSVGSGKFCMSVAKAACMLQVGNTLVLFLYF